MVQNGQRTSFYVRKHQVELCELAVAKFPEDFKSRSHVICAALNKFLRELMPVEFAQNQNFDGSKIYFSESGNALSKEEEKL